MKEGLGYVIGDGLITSNGVKHKKDRYLFHKYFMKSNIDKYKNVIIDLSNKTINELELEENKIYNISNFFSKITTRVILKYGFDVDMLSDKQFLNEDDKEFKLCNMLVEFSSLASIRALWNIPTWTIFPIIKKLNSYKNYLINDFKNVLAIYEKKKELNPEIDNFLTIMDQENMSFDEKFDHYITFLLAGQDTTSYLMSYVAYLLANHQNIQDKVRQEFNSNRKDENDYSNFPYFMMVLYETLRLYPIIPRTSRYCNKDELIEHDNIKLTIPKNTILVLPFYALNLDKNVWKNPKTFNPDRFKDVTNFTNKHFYPFGYGVRSCIGNNLALNEATIVMCNLIKKYEILPAPGFEPDLHFGISLVTKNGLDIILKKIE
jgi:cytochrome P450